jgi:hypothetical protein
VRVTRGTDADTDHWRVGADNAGPGDRDDIGAPSTVLAGYQSRRYGRQKGRGIEGSFFHDCLSVEFKIQIQDSKGFISPAIFYFEFSILNFEYK